MAVNPAGFVPIFDNATPRMLGGVAMETISGGQLVQISGAADNVSSGASSFVASDIQYALGASGLSFNGIATQTVTSGNYVSVATRGSYIIRAAGTILPGRVVAANGAEAVVADTTAGTAAGRSLSSATSGNYVLVDIQG